jgi:L-serine dehydratase
MERLSVFDIFKIGVGPSSSHTLGPWIAARNFARELSALKADHVQVHLMGSLSKTGRGHATDLAVQLGLADYDPKTINTDDIAAIIANIANQKFIDIHGQQIAFTAGEDICFYNEFHPGHPNALRLVAYYQQQVVLEKTYFSLGGGFICLAEEMGEVPADQVILPHPIDTGAELLGYCQKHQCAIEDIVYQNELAFRSAELIQESLNAIVRTMLESVMRGCKNTGILPGGLDVRRRAKSIHLQLLGQEPPEDIGEWIALIQQQPHTFTAVNKWVSCFALAVNEENASLSRVVTSPTNGAAGVIPAVMLYYLCFCEHDDKPDLNTFFFTAGEIGCLFKKGATISAAMGGCQAEIGVSSAMAAGALTAVQGGSPKQVLSAAEIAMEHHLGLTCDPIGGLVQIPCIERNAMGAMKAITASNLALSRDPDETRVHFDQVIKAMWDTAQDMNGKYKETSEGGLALQLPVVLPSC